MVSPAILAVINTPADVIEFLKCGNERYLSGVGGQGDISSSRRTVTAQNGQAPYAVVLTCSDSRVSPEHIFSAGIGELFVIRTAGNVVGELELGSIEYGVEHLGAKVVVIMGHSGCGAVSAALSEYAESNIKYIIDIIHKGIGDETDVSRAENLNIAFAKQQILTSDSIRKSVAEGHVKLVEAKYDLATGAVKFL